MLRTITALVALTCVAGCVASTGGGKGEPDELVIGPKADGPLIEHHGRVLVGSRGRAKLSPEVPGHTFDFVLSEPRVLTLAVEPLHFRADTLLTLYAIDDEGRIVNQVAEDDDGGENGASRLPDIELAAGRYRMLVRGYKSFADVTVEVAVECESCPREPVAEALPSGEPTPSQRCFEEYHEVVRSPLEEHMELVVRPGDVGLMPKPVRESIETLHELILEREWVTDEAPYLIDVYRYAGGTAVEISNIDIDGGYQQTVFDAGGRPISWMHLEETPWMQWYCGRGGAPASTLDETSQAECVAALVSLTPHLDVVWHHQSGAHAGEDLSPRALRAAVVTDTSVPLLAADLVAVAMQAYAETRHPAGAMDFELDWRRTEWGSLVSSVRLSAEGEPTITYEVTASSYDTFVITATPDGEAPTLVCDRA